MKKILGLALILFVSLPAAAASAHQAELLAIVNSLMDTIASGDKAPWQKHLADEFVLLDRDGSVKSKQFLVENTSPMSRHYTIQLALDEVESADYGDAAVMRYRVLEDMTVYGQPIHVEYRNSHVFTKRDGAWKMVLWQYVEIPADGPPVQVSAKRLEKIAGVYQLAPDVDFVVTLRGGTLYGVRKGRPEVELVPESDDVFYVRGSEFRKIFVRDADGEVVEMLDRRKGTDTRWKRVKAQG